MAETAEMVETAEIEEKTRTCSLALLVSVGFHVAMGRIANYSQPTYSLTSCTGHSGEGQNKFFRDMKPLWPSCAVLHECSV